eukprot:TRINITY_DN29629_c0_g1_i1.p1 TRINITY_DN29629_c0_g1~~TRINITY_DN29629_c0_g1_i1.p1  ORF type:complete len:1139 (+),score=159.82 TRINITY_DN29629_c0_g1_i1:61-3477(+)
MTACPRHLRGVLIVLASLRPALAQTQTPCIDATMFPDIPNIPKLAADRTMVNISGQSVRIGVAATPSLTSRWAAEIFKVMLEEIIGYHATIEFVDTEKDAYFAVAGCGTPPASATTPFSSETTSFFESGDGRCTSPSRAHVTFEIWKTQLPWMSAITNFIAEFEAKFPQFAPQNSHTLGVTGYQGIFVQPKVYEAIWSDSSRDMRFGRSFNASWLDVSSYFSNITDIQESDLKTCSSLSKLSDPATVSNFIRHTNDTAGIDGTRFKCWNNDRWFVAPACRSDTSKCIPLITGGDGWLIESLLQQVTFYNWPVAIAVAADSSTSDTNQIYKDLVRNKDVMFYWWFPDDSFADIQDIWKGRVKLDVHSIAEWLDNKFTTETDIIQFRSYASLDLQTFFKPYGLATTLDIQGQDVEWFLREYRSRNPTPDLRSLACDWLKVKENRNRAELWVPSDKECGPGYGMVNDKGQYVAEMKDAKTCDWCVKGTNSTRKWDVTTSRPGWTHICRDCPLGRKQGSGGQMRCEVCGQGTYASERGATTCETCEKGRYQSARESFTCESCPAGMTTDSRGKINQTACICPKGKFRPCRKPDGTLRPECQCNPEHYAPAQSDACISVPEGMEAMQASDEANFPCNESSNQEGIYPKPKAGFYVSYSQPLWVYKCDNKEVCPGGYLQRCSEAAFDIACGKCEDGYFAQDGKCAPCGDVLRVPIIPIICVLMVPFILAALYKSGLEDVEMWGHPKYMWFAISYVTLIFMQTMGTNLSIMPAVPEAVDMVVGWMSILKDITSQFRIECSTTQDFALQIMGKISTPMVMAVCFLAIYVILYPTKFRLDANVFVGIYGSLFNACFIMVANICFTLFQTYKHPNGEKSVIAAPSVLTSSKSWQNMQVAAGFAIVVYCAIFAAGNLYAIIKAPSNFQYRSFRKRWKFVMLQMRPSAWWWMFVSIIKGLYLAFTTVIFDSTVGQAVWLGNGLLLYFLGVFYFLPWRNYVALGLDVFYHYMLSIFCLMLPFFAVPSEDDRSQIAGLFIAVFFIFVVIAVGLLSCLIWVQSPQAQRFFLLKFDRDSRKIVDVFHQASDEKQIKEMLLDLPDHDMSLVVQCLNLLKTEMLGIPAKGRLQWREHGLISLNKDDSRGPMPAAWL